MFLGGLDDDKSWSSDSVVSTRKWLDRVFRLFVDKKDLIKTTNNKELEYDYNLFVKESTDYIESLKFNLTVSSMMVFINKCYQAKELYKPYLEGFIKIFSTMAPHLGEELWEMMGYKKTLTFEKWPTSDETKIVKDEITLIVQVNGKVRGKVEAKKDITKAAAIKLAKDIENVKTNLEGKQILKEIFVPGKLISFVVK
jgi:leucyl-tRNA synthetase